MNYTLITDGACHPNPGRMDLGIALLDDSGILIAQKYIKEKYGSNNVAETLAFLRGLELAQEKGITHLDCFADSSLLVNHLSGAYKINKPELKELHSLIRNKKSDFKFLSIAWHARETPLGMLADALSRGILFEENKSVWEQIPQRLQSKIKNQHRTQTSS